MKEFLIGVLARQSGLVVNIKEVASARMGPEKFLNGYLVHEAELVMTDRYIAHRFFISDKDYFLFNTLKKCSINLESEPPNYDPDRAMDKISVVMNKPQCKVTVEQIPEVLLPYRVERQPSEKTFALTCDCQYGLFCPIVSEKILDGKDFAIWGNKVPKAPAGGETFFSLCVPVFGSILYSFRIKSFWLQSWSGTAIRQLVVFGVDEVDATFYEWPDKQSSIMLDQLQMISSLQNPARFGFGDHVDKFINAYAAIPCNGRSHTYGTNNKLLADIVSARSDATEGSSYSSALNALALSLRLYKLCTICYTNSNAVFSLVKI